MPNQPQTPSQPQHHAGEQQQQSEGAGGFFGGLFQDFAENLGFEIKEIHMAHPPWLEYTQIGWRVGNTGNKAYTGYQIYLQVVDTNNSDKEILRKDYQAQKEVPPEGQVDHSLKLEDTVAGFNVLAEQSWSMNSRHKEFRLHEDHKYRFDVWIDTAKGWDKKGSVEFGVELEHLAGETDTHECRTCHIDLHGDGNHDDKPFRKAKGFKFA